MVLCRGDLDLKKHIELIETYRLLDFKRDLRDDLIDLQAKIISDMASIVLAYAAEYGAHPELGLLPR